MIHVGTLIEFDSGIQYEVIKVFSQTLVDLRAIKPQFEWMPDYLPIYLSIELKNFKILVHQSEAPKVSKHEDSGKECRRIEKFPSCPVIASENSCGKFSCYF